MKRALKIYLPTIAITLGTLWVSIFTQWHAACFYVAGIFIASVALWFGLPLSLASKEKLRARADARLTLFRVSPVEPGSRSERLYIGFSRLLGWSAIIGSCFVIWILISTALKI